MNLSAAGRVLPFLMLLLPAIPGPLLASPHRLIRPLRRPIAARPRLPHVDVLTFLCFEVSRYSARPRRAVILSLISYHLSLIAYPLSLIAYVNS